MQIRKTYLYLQRLTRYIMQNIEQKTPLANNHISVDCVVIGFDGEQLKVLLIKRAGEEEGESVSFISISVSGYHRRSKHTYCILASPLK